MASPPPLDLCSLVIISATLNVTGGLCWLLEALRDRAVAAQARPADGAQTGDAAPPDRPRMYRLVDLVLSQTLALYALFLLLWLPLVQESFQPASPEVVSLTLPAVCVSAGRHIFCSLRGWRSGRGAVSSSAHVISAVLHLLFLQSRCTLVLPVLAMLTELGGVYTQAAAAAGERRAALFPCWAAGVGLLLSVLFSGLAYLVVLALALARRSPLAMPSRDVALFFSYVAFSFISNTYAIYLVMASFCTGLLEARAAAAAADKRSGPAGLPVPPQALANMGATLSPAAAQMSPRSHGARKFSDGDLLILNMV